VTLGEIYGGTQEAADQPDLKECQKEFQVAANVFSLRSQARCSLHGDDSKPAEERRRKDDQAHSPRGPKRGQEIGTAGES